MHGICISCNKAKFYLLQYVLHVFCRRFLYCVNQFCYPKMDTDTDLSVVDGEQLQDEETDDSCIVDLTEIDPLARDTDGSCTTECSGDWSDEVKQDNLAVVKQEPDDVRCVFFLYLFCRNSNNLYRRMIWICPIIGKPPSGSITPVRRRCYWQCSDFKRDLNVLAVELLTVSSCRLFHAGIAFTKNECLNIVVFALISSHFYHFLTIVRH